jgi:hypothetical protein
MAAWGMAVTGKVLSSVALVILRSRRTRQNPCVITLTLSLIGS